MKTTILSFVITLLFSCPSILAQGNSFTQLPNKDLIEAIPQDVSLHDSLVLWQEQIMLHLDKPIITKDTPLFFKAYTLTGPNRVRATLSKVLKVELINNQGQLVTKQFHKIENGESEGAIQIPKKLEEGTYTIRAYTRWMQNYGESFYYTKKLTLGSNLNTKNTDTESSAPLEISFHPEGGQLIDNFNNRLLIKIRTNRNKVGDLNGEIVDSNKQVVAATVPFSATILSTIFTPKPNETYKLKMSDGSDYKLPESKAKGYLLSVNNLDPASISIRVKATSEFANSKIWLKGEVGGVGYFEKELQLHKASAEVNVPKEGIPSGVMTISLNDEDGKQWAKRPLAIDARNNLKLSLSPVDEDSNKDELAFKVTVTDLQGEPVSAEVSLSATNNTDSKVLRSYNTSSFSWEEPKNGKSNKQSKRKKQFVEDLELLTLANNNFSTVFTNAPDKIKYPFQQGLDLFGYAYNLDNELLKNTKIQMIGSSEEDVIAKEFTTDLSGRIRVENLQFVGKTELIFRTVGDDSSSRLVKIVPFQENFETKKNSGSTITTNPRKKSKIVDTSPWMTSDEEEVVELDEVEITQKKQVKRKATPSLYGVKPTRVKFQNVESPRTIPQLFLGIPGVQVVGLGTLEPRISLPRAAGMGPVLWVLDGLPLQQPTGLNDIISSVSYVDVERIEILFGPQASIYGSRAGGGAILIYTRSGAGMDYLNRKDGHLNFQGYFESPTFEDYIGEFFKRPKKYKNEVTTLFWNPSIKTDQNGEAIIRFKVPVDYKQLELKATTITQEGAIGSTKVIF